MTKSKGQKERKRNRAKMESASQSGVSPAVSPAVPVPVPVSVPAPGAMNRNMPDSVSTNENNGGGNGAGRIPGASHVNGYPADDSSLGRNSTSSNGSFRNNKNNNNNNNNNACTKQEEHNLHVFLRDSLAQRNAFTGVRGQNQRQPFEHISGRTRQWPAILHPGSVALVLVALLPPDPSLALLQDCLIRHCRTVGIPWLELKEHAHDQGQAKSNHHRFLWDCITDKGAAACLFFPRGMVDLRVMLESRPKPLAEPMRDRALDNLYSNMGWTRALCNAPEREQVYKLVLDCIAERQGYLPMEQELQIVLQQVEARTTRLVLLSSQVWQQKLKDTLLLLQQCWDQQVPIFLVYDYHFCNNKRFPAVFSLRSIHLAREWQLQDLQELCRTMLARPLLMESPSALALGGTTGMGLGSVGGPSSPAGSIKSVARPIGGVATAPALPIPQSTTREVPDRASSVARGAINDYNSNSSLQGNISTVAAREPGMAAASTRPVEEVSNGVSVESKKRGPLTERILPPSPEMAMSREATSESPADLILSPGEISVPEQDRFLRTLADHQVILRSSHLVSTIAFECEKWPRWLHPDRIGFVLFVSAKQSKSATTIFTKCLIRYCQKVGIPCLRFRKEDESASNSLRNMISNSDVGLCFDRSLVDLKYLLDKERRPDLLVSTMARRAPSKLSSDLTWSIAICGWEERIKCMKFRRAENNPVLRVPVPAQIARVSQLVEDNKALIVIIASSIWQQQVEVTISMIQRCKQLQIAVFLVHDEDFGEVAKFHAILSVNKDNNDNDKRVDTMQELSQRLLARGVPLRLAQVLQSCMDPFCTSSETKVVWDLRRRHGPSGVHIDRRGNDSSQDDSDSSSAIICGAHNVKVAIDKKKSHLVFVSLNWETTVDTDLFSCLKLWWKAKTPLLFMRNDGCNGDKAVVFCLTSGCPQDENILQSLQAVSEAKRKQISDDVVLLGDSTKGAGLSAPGMIDPTRYTAGLVKQPAFPLERQIILPLPDESSRQERVAAVPYAKLNNDPPTKPSLQETLVESIQSTVTRKRQRDDQGSPGSNEDVDAGILPISRSEDPSHQHQRPCVHTHVEEAPPSGHICTVREETNIYELLRKHLARADDSQRQQSLVRIGLNTEMWPQLLHPDRVGLVLVARRKPPSLKCLSDCVVEYCRRVAIPCLVLREGMDGDSNISLRKLVAEDEMTCLGIRQGLCDLKDVVELEKRPWILASQIRSKTIPKHTSGMSWTKLLCNERQQEQVFSLLYEYVSDQTQDCFPCVKEQITHLLGMFDKMSNNQANKKMVVITAEAWLHHLPETNVLIQKCKKLCTPLFLIYHYPPSIGKRECSCIIVSSISAKKRRDLQNLFRLGLEMAARPDHPSVTESRSVSVSYWKDGLCDASESEAVLQLLGKCQFPASSGAIPSSYVSRDLAASTSLILCGARSVRLCVLQKRAILVFVALDSGGAFQTEAVFALVELCRELGTPFLFVQEEVCVREVLYADKKQPIVFCLTSVLADDEDILRSLQDLAAIKRKKVLGEFFQSVNVESCVNNAVSKTTKSSPHGVDLVVNDDDNAMVEDTTKVSSVETSPHQNTAEITITDVSRRQIPLIQSVTYVSVPTDKELFLLEEAVSIFEGSLETLIARKDKVKAKLSHEQDKRVHQVESVANLQLRSEQLHTAHTRQLELEQELTKSIARSRTQLGRLAGHGSVLSTEDISELSGADGHAHASSEIHESSTTKDLEESVSDQPFLDEPKSARLLNHPIGGEKIPLNVPVEWHP